MGEEISGSVVSTPLGFDATVTTLLAPLVVGKRVELLPEDETMLPGLAERMFGKSDDAGDGDGAVKESLLFKITPAHLEALEYVERRVETSLSRHVVVIGGEQLGAERVRRWKQEWLPEARFVNEYGPTETVVGCSVWELGGGDEEQEEQKLKELEGRVAAPIGQPI